MINKLVEYIYSLLISPTSRLSLNACKVIFCIVYTLYTSYKLTNHSFFYVGDTFYGGIIVQLGYLISIGLVAGFVFFRSHFFERAILFILVFMLARSHSLFIQGVDTYIQLFLFYGIFIQEEGIYRKYSKYELTEVSSITINLFKVHFVMTYVVSGLGKFSSATWQEGIGFWTSLAMFTQYESLLALDPKSFLLKFVNYFVLYLEIFLPFLLFSKFYIWGFCIMMLFHIFIFLGMKVYFLSFICIGFLFLFVREKEMLAITDLFKLFRSK